MSVKQWSTNPSENSSAPPFGAPEGWAPSDVNDVVRQLMASVRAQFEEGGWFDYGHDLTRLAGNSFAAQGNRIEVYSLGRKVRVSGTNTGVHYGEVIESVFNGDATEVTLILYSGSIQPDDDFAVAAGVDSNILPQVSGPIIRLISSGQTFSYDNSGGTPELIGPNDITFTVNRYNSSSPVTWTVFDATGTEVSSVLDDESNQGATLTALAFAGITENDFVRVRASADGVFDEVSIFRLVSGRDGEASEDVITAFLTNESHVVPSQSDGSSPVLTGAEGEFKVFEGVTDQTDSATFSILETQGCTATLNTLSGDPVTGQPRGFYRVTGMTADAAQLRMRAVFDGVTRDRTFSLAKSRQGFRGDDADLFYIKPMTGTAIKNSDGQIVIEARRVTGSSNTILTEGTIRLYDPDDNIVNEANGYGTGSDGFTGVFNPENILGSILITLKDGPSGTPLDTITLIDVTDGLDATIGSINASDGLVWKRDGSNNWVPSGTTNTVTAKFFRGGVEVAARSLIVTLNTGDGTLSAASDEASGEATTFQTSGAGTQSLSLTFQHTDSGVSVQETIATVIDGTPGLPGEDGPPGQDGQDGQDGVDGVSTRAIYRRSADQPATPANTSANSPIPGNWYANISEVPSSSNPLWMSVGNQIDRDADWVWQPPVRIETIDGETGPPGDPGIEIVEDFPTEGNFIGRVIFHEPTQKLWRFTSEGWTAAVPAVDIEGQLTSAQIESVLANQIQGQLTSGQVQSIVADQVTGQLTSAQIEEVLASQITGLINSNQINSLVASKISGQITGTQVANNAITTPKIAANAITANEILAGAVTAAKVSAGAIEADKLAANSVTAAAIQAGAVNADKLAANSVTASAIAADSVTANAILAGAVNADKIAANAITADKIAANAITAANITAGAIGVDQLAANSVSSDKVQANAIVASKIAANAVTADKILAGAVTAAKISVTNLAAVSANTGTLTANLIRTAASGTRLEISNSGSFPLWFGTGTKNTSNGVFYVTTGGDAVFAGNLAANTVTTGNIQLGAVSEVETAYEDGMTFVGTAWADITPQISVTSPGGVPVLVEGLSQFNLSAGFISDPGEVTLEIELGITRNGTLIHSRTVSGLIWFESAGFWRATINESKTVKFADTPAAGAHNYRIQARVVRSGWTASPQATKRFISAQILKR